MKKIIFVLMLAVSAITSLSYATMEPELAITKVKNLKGDKISLKKLGVYHGQLFRTSVPGGWLVMRYDSDSSSLPTSGFVFIPDYNHEWKLAAGNSLTGETYSLKKLGVSKGIMYRVSVPGGWLVGHFDEGFIGNLSSSSLLFVADEYHQWTIE